MTDPDRLTQWKDFVEQVRAASPVLDVIGADTELRRSGRGHKGISPLRAERTPSFYAYPDNESWFDFGSTEGGDVFTYVEKRDNCDFRTAVDTLAHRAGLTWDASGLAVGDEEWLRAAEGYLERRRVQALTTEIVEWMHRALPNKIRAYIRDHYGLDDFTIDRFKIGWAPGCAWAMFHEEHGYDRAELLRTGLFVELVKDGTVVDFYEHRIVFPYWQGAYVAYSIGRRFEPMASDAEYDIAKYKKQLTHNDKHPYVSKTVINEVFYNEDILRRERVRLVITEGVTDCIAITQVGVSCISPVTIRFRDKDTPKLVASCARVQTVYLLNDADILEDGREPGKEGALKTAIALFREGKDVRIGVLPRPVGVRKIDACEFIRDAERAGKDARTELEAVLAVARKLPDFLLSEIPDGLDDGEVEKRIGPICQMVGTLSEIEREGYAKKIVRRFKLPKRAVRAMIEAHIPAPEPAQGEAEGDGATKSKAGTAEDRLRGKVCEDIGFYYVESAFGTEQISSFSLVLRKMIEDEKGALVCADIVLENGNVLLERHVFPRSAWNGKREFLRALPSPRLQWTGNDDNVQGVLRILMTREVPYVRGTTVLGYHEAAVTAADGTRRTEGRYVVPQGTIGPRGWLEDPDLVYIPTGATIASKVLFEQVTDDDTRELARQALPLLFAVNTADVAVPIAGLTFANVFKPRIQRRIGHYPTLNVWGTQGSGKTSLMTKVFGVIQGINPDRSEPFSVTETDFVFVRHLSASNTIPAIFDEYKPADMGGRHRVDRFLRLIRRAYSGETEERGRTDQGTNVYSLSTPIVVMGEAKIEGDPAIAERVIPVAPDKNLIQRDSTAAMAFRRLSGMPLHRLAPSYARWSLSVDVDELLDEAVTTTKSMLARVDRVMPQRAFDNLTVMVFGLLALDRWAQGMGVELPTIDFDGAFLGVTNEIVEGTNTGSVRDAFDELLEEFSTMAQLGALSEGIHYCFVEQKLHVHLPAALSAYAAWKRGMGQEDRTNGLRALRRILREKIDRGGSYVVEVDKRVRVNGESQVRCVVIDPEKVPEALEFESFPLTKPRAHGGDRWGPKSGVLPVGYAGLPYMGPPVKRSGNDDGSN